MQPLTTLPKGRHQLSREQISASQRTRLIRATAQLTNERGFPALTLTDIVTLAGVARSTFYEYFADKEQCFLAAFDHAADLVLSCVIVLEPTPDGRFSSPTDLYIARFLDLSMREPDLARLVASNAGALGPAAAERERVFRDRLAQGLVKLRDSRRGNDPLMTPISHIRALAIVGALSEVLQRTFYTSGVRALPTLHAEMAAILRALLKEPPAGVPARKPARRR